MEYSITKIKQWKTMTLSDKLCHYKTQLDQRFEVFVDKLKAKQYIDSLKIKDLYTSKIIRILIDEKDIRRVDLHKNNMLKAAHGSNWNIDLSKKNGKHITFIKKKLKQWNRVFSEDEKQYSSIRPVFFIEEKLFCKYRPNSRLTDFKFFCIHGKPIVVSVEILINHVAHMNIYDLNWKVVKYEGFEFEKPEEFQRMKEICELLCKPFEFVRMDFWITNQGIYFSEFTFTPSNCKCYWGTVLNHRLGKLWT